MYSNVFRNNAQSDILLKTKKFMYSKVENAIHAYFSWFLAFFFLWSDLQGLMTFGKRESCNSIQKK